MTTIALVHGAWHGAWCWERVSPLLEARGHQVVAVDLPSDDQNATFGTYAECVVHALESVSGDGVVAVGHSVAGQTIPLVADRRPVRKLIYLCGLVPIPGRSFEEQLGMEPDTLIADHLAGLRVDDEGRTYWGDADAARSAFYGDCSADVARAAFERLRPQALTPQAEPCPLSDHPPIPTTYIVCAEDGIANPERGRMVARDRLRAELVELPGSHSPFLSRPRELAEVLHRQAG